MILPFLTVLLKNTEERDELTILPKMKTKTQLTIKNDLKMKLKKLIKKLRKLKMNDLIKIDLEADSEIPHPLLKYSLLF